MKRFWKWVVDQKISTIRKWQSVVLHLDHDHEQDGRHLKPIGGSDDELERKQKQNSKIFQEENNHHRSSISLQDFDIEYGNEPIDFEEFFEESSVAIESALVGFHLVFEAKKFPFFTLKTDFSLSNYFNILLGKLHLYH
ncbi:hypothetical protein LOAG_06893 [Loa loa]|uniref:Uncharacterized protein n=1 Tax=Loa loa TaxID=7209 RepID=A0A1S0TX12_LOALO|nr:hypothetical protein LOAG_06893 [Loa loa]EFO21592.1 hypothetical protein LOAG_06893 [Loa loa]